MNSNVKMLNILGSTSNDFKLNEKKEGEKLAAFSFLCFSFELTLPATLHFKAVKRTFSRTFVCNKRSKSRGKSTNYYTRRRLSRSMRCPLFYSIVWKFKTLNIHETNIHKTVNRKATIVRYNFVIFEFAARLDCSSQSGNSANSRQYYYKWNQVFDVRFHLCCINISI